MKFFKWIGISTIALIAIFLIVGLFIAKDYKVERSIVINQEQSIIINKIKSLKEFSSWSPWAALDPNQKTTFEGNDSEVGSKQIWEGNDDVGKGMMTITAITPDRVEYDLKFIEPFESLAKSYYETSPAENGTKLTWGMTGTNPYPFNVFSVFMDMDKMIGKDFEKGLGSLKKELETK